jgi:hypothetical protein
MIPLPHLTILRIRKTRDTPICHQISTKSSRGCTIIANSVPKLGFTLCTAQRFEQNYWMDGKISDCAVLQDGPENVNRMVKKRHKSQTDKTILRTSVSLL